MPLVQFSNQLSFAVFIFFCVFYRSQTFEVMGFEPIRLKFRYFLLGFRDQEAVVAFSDAFIVFIHDDILIDFWIEGSYEVAGEANIFLTLLYFSILEASEKDVKRNQRLIDNLVVFFKLFVSFGNKTFLQIVNCILLEDNSQDEIN
jgi:hypothetical protein